MTTKYKNLRTALLSVGSIAGIGYYLSTMTTVVASAAPIAGAHTTVAVAHKSGLYYLNVVSASLASKITVGVLATLFAGATIYLIHKGFDKELVMQDIERLKNKLNIK